MVSCVGIGRAVALACALVAIALVSASSGLAAPRAADFGPEVALGEPSGGYVGRLSVSPSHGPVGTPVTVSGEGFPAEQEVQLIWTTVKGSWKVTIAEYLGRQFTPVAYQIAKLKTDKDGRIATKFVAPEDFGFMHDVVVQQGTRVLTQAGFSIDMTMKLLRESGPLGTEIPVEVQGIGWRELEGSWVLVYDNKYTGFASAITTSGTARFNVPATGHVGLHVLEIIHTDFGSPYRNMQQSPAPDRPQFKVNFTITPGAPVLPPPPEQQAQKQVRMLPPQGELVATPTFGGIHQPVTVKGSGFEPGKTVVLNWATVTGNRISGGGWEERSRPIAEAKADAAGNVEFHFTAPDDLGGSHGLWADAGGKRKNGTFWIMPTALPLDVARGPAGTTFRIHLKGVGWSETANIYTLVYDNATSGYACGFNSQGDIEIVMQATGEPGWHFIDLYPAIYKGRETRPNNYRLPQLTFADDHPGEDLPRFRFAFEVTPTTTGQAH
jgi:hypothetical protein